jgi:hypothetical protein
VGLGGLLAVEALAAGALIDDLILWAVPSRGQTYLRELRMHADLISGSIGESHPERSDGALELSGYLMSAETAAILNATRLTDLAVQPEESRRVLLLGRDGRGVDDKLVRLLDEPPTDVTVMEASDHEQLMAHPEASRVPRESIAATIDWLGQAAVVTSA